MSNIKFERLGSGDPALGRRNSLQAFLPPGREFLVLGSVRRKEETDVSGIISEIRQRRPETIIGLFPRHLHRIPHWQRILRQKAIPWLLRSEIQQAPQDGSVILWDVFGELGDAYFRAAAAFVGGSLAPLGGQNFLEPLVSGVSPVIGPYWDNFKWVGQEVIAPDLVRQAANWKEVAEMLIEAIMEAPPREAVKRRAAAYIRTRQGGAEDASRLIETYLST
jgi:3-deoxy-D-manno-octulosonic-acid transferase